MELTRRRLMWRVEAIQSPYVLFPLSGSQMEWDFISEYNDCLSIANKKYLLVFNSSVTTYLNESGATMYFCEKSISSNYTAVSNGSTYTFTTGSTKRYAIGTSSTITKYHNGVIAMYTGNASSITYGAASTTAGADDCTTLQQVYYTDDLKTLGTLAFAHNTSITTTPLIRGSINRLDDAFRGNINMSGVLDLSQSSITSLNNGAFNSVGTNTTNGLTSIIFPTSSCTANGGVFWAVKAVADITIPATLAVTSTNFFGNATGIKSVTVNNSIAGTWAFRQDGVTSTQRTMKTITLGTNCAALGSNTFYQCTAVTNVYLNWVGDAIITYPSSAFNSMGSASNRTVHVPAGQSSNYSNKGWGSLGTIVES